MQSSNWSVLVWLVLLGGCGGDDPDKMPEPNPYADDPIRASLHSLGVDTTDTPRVDGEGDALPDSYAPMGSRASLTKIDELMIAGVALTGFADTVNLFDWTPETLNPDGSVATPSRVAPVSTQAPSNWDLATHRGAIGVDIDADGREEMIAVFRSDVDSQLYARIQQDESGAFQQTEEVLGDDMYPNIVHIELGKADVDADGTQEIVVGVVEVDQVTMLVLDSLASGALVVVSAHTRVIAAEHASASLAVSIAGGNLDNDAHEEIAMVVNELFNDAGEQGAARLFVFDASESGLTAAHDGLAVVTVSSDVFALKIAGCAIADTNGDGLAELVLAGLSTINSNCDNWPDNVVGVFRLVESGIDAVTSFKHTPDYHACESAGPARIRTVFVNALDIDGDQIDELAINQTVYDDALAGWAVLASYPDAFFPQASGALEINRTNSAVTVGDVTSDSRDNLVYVNNNSAEVGVYGMNRSPAGVLSFARQGSFPIAASSAGKPLLVTLDVDHDSFAMVYSPSEYKLIFTEPVLIAVLAAPPCFADRGQNTDDCTTSFGNTDISGTSQEGSFTVSASYIWGAKSGVEAPVVKVGVEAEVTKKVSVALSATLGHAYTFEKSITYRTGPLEDNVIFTTIPYDQYTYHVLSHPDPAQVGQRIVFLVPRDPVTLQVERSFYNQHYVQGGIAVDASILTHTAGDPWSYATAADKDALVGRYGGLQSDLQPVGQGTGNVELSLDVSTEWSAGGALEIGYEYESKGTAGVVIGGFSVGGSVGLAMNWSTGSAASYSGTVGNMSGEFFADDQYGFGLFTYKFTHGYGQEFQVINYWVQ